MVIDIKMCRFDNVPWGFRLVGGSDYEYPLTVVKVTEGSIAEEAGLRADDVIVRINDTAASPLTHDEVNKMINHCGNVFYFGVSREAEEVEEPTCFPIVDSERPATPESMLTAGNSRSGSICVPPTEEQQHKEYLPELADRPSSVLSENTEIKLVEEEIAAVLSGESEVLKEHNVLGIFPKPGVCMTSDVLRTLNEEAIKTKAEKDKENKKWTTFLQKPDRPIPKSKEQIEAERRAANAYKVKIGKSTPVSPVVQKPTEIAKEPTPPKSEATVEATPTPESEPEVEEAPPTDSEVPNLEEPTDDANSVEVNNLSDEEKADKEKEAVAEHKEADEDKPQSVEEEANKTAVAEQQSAAAPAPAKTEEELALERQLADVQKQLAALSSLPSTIQATLDAVTKQLGELLPTFKLQLVEQPKTELVKETNETGLENIKEHNGETEEDMNENAASDQLEVKKEEGDGLIESQEDNKENGNVEVKKETDNKSIDMESCHAEDAETLKKQKRHDVIEELEEHLERKQHPKQRSKRAFGPLTPSSERPVVLPGGRRWYRPKDAYNDEFIAETLSAQAELITGTTLGVNFMKYQKPEKKIDLNRSEVYKVIHHLDRQPVRGIEVRPPVVPAAADIKQAVGI